MCYFKTFLGFVLAACIVLMPARASETLFDNGPAVNNAGSAGGRGFETNELIGFQAVENFNFVRESSIESVHFRMAGGTGPFRFTVYADKAGQPDEVKLSVDLDVNEYIFNNFQEFSNFRGPPDASYEFHFDLDPVLTLDPGNYWVSFLGTGTSSFYTVGTGSGDGFLLNQLGTNQFSFRTGGIPFRLDGQRVSEQVAFIDIKPGSDDNPINPRSKGVIPVAVLTSNDFDAQQIDVTTVVFGPKLAIPAHNGHIEDVNNDGLLDMLFHFRTEDTGIECGDTEAFLSGTAGGQSFSNFDSITTVGCSNPDPDPDPDPDPGDGDTGSGGSGGSDAAAADWTTLLALAMIGLLAFQRRRISDL